MEQVALMLGGLRQSARQWEQARDELDDQLVATVDAGATFEQIAQNLGLKSRQAAHRRYVAAIGRMDRGSARRAANRTPRERNRS